MSEYWVTFRIENGAGYDARYDALMDAATSYKMGFWAESTSFMLVESGDDIDAFTKKLSAGLDAEKDLLVVRRISQDSSRYFGAIEKTDVLKSFFPKIKKI